jgi:hypothetical protein
VLNGKKAEKKEISSICGNFPPSENGRPMIDFESLKELFEFLKFVNAPKKIKQIQVGGVWQEPCIMWSQDK